MPVKTARSSSARSSTRTNDNFGFDAQNGEYGNLVSKGIIDPTKVVRSALQDAASIAGLLITTEAMVAEAPEAELRPGHAARRRHGLLQSDPGDVGMRIEKARAMPGPFRYACTAEESCRSP